MDSLKEWARYTYIYFLNIFAFLESPGVYSPAFGEKETAVTVVQTSTTRKPFPSMLADVDVGHCFIGPYKEPFIHSTARQDMFMLF